MKYMFGLCYLEIVKGCNLSCAFCPTVKGEKIHCMNDETIEQVAVHFEEYLNESKKRFRLCLSGRGEPSLHPKLMPIVRRLSRIKNIRLSILTNGAKLSQEWTEEIFNAGLHGLHIDCYNETTLKKANEILYPVPVNPIEIANVWTNLNKGVVILDETDLESPSRNLSIRNFHNWAGATDRNRFPRAYKGDVPRKSPCASPLRTIQIWYDGRYAFCCLRWLEHKTFGDVFSLSLKETYDLKERMDAAFVLSHRDSRHKIPGCEQCTYIDARSHVFKPALKDRGYEV